MGLEVFPGSPIVYKHFAAFRLLVQGVNAATVELDFTAFAVMHTAFRELLKLSLKNPIKNAEIKSMLKKITKSVRVKASATRSFAMRDFLTLVKSLDMSDPRQFHLKILLMCVGLGSLRQNAMKKMRLVRISGQLFTTDFCPHKCDMHIFKIPDIGLTMCLRKEVDKNLPPGRDHFVYIPEILPLLGLTPVSDMIRYLTTLPVPDGPLFACPSGSRGTSFNKTEYTALDLSLARCWATNFPDRVDEKIAPHSLRKMMIQALYDHFKLTGVAPDGPVGEIVGWHSIKQITRAHYVQLSMT